MPRATIQEIRATSEFQKTYEWYFTFLRQPGAITISGDRFDMQCISTEVPHKQSTPERIMMRGEQIFDMGIYVVTGKLNLTFVETIDSVIHQMFVDWETACATRTDTFNNLTADIRLATMDNQETDNWEFWILWSFPTDFEYAKLEGGQQGAPPEEMSFNLCYTDYDSKSVSSNA